MSCKVTIYHPITGLEVESRLWNQINSEVLNENYADKLYAQTRSQQFLAWFGNSYNQGESTSKVIHEDTLEPLVVYHSSPVNFDSFDNEKSKELGFHFGTLSASLDRFSPSKMVLFEDGEQSEGQIIDISKDIRRTGLLEDGYTVKPYFLNIRNMIEGVDNLDYNPDGFSQEDFYLKSYLDEVTFTNDFKVLVLTFYQKGKITIDQVDQILYTGMLSDGNNGPEALRRALGNPDGYWYKNKKEDEGSISYVVFDPKNIKSIYNNGDFSENENTLFNLNSDTSVDFTLKVINALQKTPRKTYPSGSIQGFYNDLTKQGAPKNQIELLKNYILRNNIQDINVADLIIGLAAEISFTVEIETAKDRDHSFEYDRYTIGSEIEQGKETKFYVADNVTVIKYFKTWQEAQNYIENELKQLPPNSSYYDGMTVSGGTNYTENNINTPAITPAIKGHARFATDKGIGWFRSDDRATMGSQNMGLLGPKGEQEFTIPEEMNIFEGKAKTRRILEIQSDLFQKGRGKEDLISKVDEETIKENKDANDYIGKEVEYNGEKWVVEDVEFKTKDEYFDDENTWSEKVASLFLTQNFNNDTTYPENPNAKIKFGVYLGEVKLTGKTIFKSNAQVDSKNQFLQLLNKDNNWVTFFVKSIIQDSAKKGYEKVLFPKLDTIIQIESEGKFKTYEEAEKFYKTPEWIAKNDKAKKELDEAKALTEQSERFIEISKHSTYNFKEWKNNAVQRAYENWHSLQPSLLNTAKFYENDITNILKKQGYNPTVITDEYGNTWNEIEITSKAYDTILFNLKKQGYYKSIPENLLGVMSRNSILSKLTRNLEDRWYFVRGELDQNNNINDNVARYNQFMSMNNINKDMFVYNNTEGDKAPYLTINPKFKEEDTIVENDEKIHKEKYEAIIQFFQDKFGIKKEQIVYTSKEQFKKQFPEAYKENMQSVYSNGKFYFFTRNLTSDITVEELLHPFIYTVKEINPALFENLLKEAQKAYPKLNAKIQSLYADRTKSVRDQELVTQALSRVFNNVYENEEPQSFLDIIKDFIYWLRNIMNQIFNEYNTGKVINIPIDRLPVQTSLYEIAKILNATDTKFDIIYPDNIMHSLEENTENFNKIIENILTNEKVATKVNEIFAKLSDTLKSTKNKLNNTVNEIEKKNLQAIIKNIEKLESEDNENLIAFQLKGILASVQLSNELIKNLNAMSNSDYDDNIKLSYYMSVYKTAKAMDSFKDLIIELKDELSTNLVLPNTKDINTFIGMLGKAISSEDEITHKIQKLVKTPLLNKLVESSEYSYSPKIVELKSKIAELETKIANPNISQKDKNNYFNKISPLRRELKSILEKAPTRENLEKVLNDNFKDANILSLIFESKIANGNPLVATLQNWINDLYDNAGRDMLSSKNEAQQMMDKYSKATGFDLRDMNKRYEQIRDIVAIPTELKLDENDNPVLDDEGNYQFNYVNQDTLLSEIDNSYITQYLELEMIKDFYLTKHRDNKNNKQVDENIFIKYRESLNNFQQFIDNNSEKEFSQEIYDFKSIMDEVVGDKTIREITGNIYTELDEQYFNLEIASDSISRQSILQRIKDIHIELKRLRTEYDANGNKKTGDDLKIAELLIKYNKLRNEYYEPTLSEDSKKRYEFDIQELEKKKQQYINSGNEETYKKNLSRIQEEVVSPDYFEALSSISGEISELTNVLADIASQSISQYFDKDTFKEKRKDIYDEIRQLAKPYRDEDGVIDGITMVKEHPEVALKIRDLQQYLEDLKYETSRIGKLSLSERNELLNLKTKEEKTQEEQNRLQELVVKQKTFFDFKKQNKDLLEQINSLYQQLHDLTISFTTDYYDEELNNKINLEKINLDIIKQAKDFLIDKKKFSVNGVIYEKGIKGKDENIWYMQQVLGKKITYIPINDTGETGNEEALDIVIGFLANESVKNSQWWKDNHYTSYQFDKVSELYVGVSKPIYIWEHQSPRNPNFIETKPTKQYYKYSIKNSYIKNGKNISLINENYKLTYRGIPFPKKGKFENDRYKKIKKDSGVFEFLNYFTNKYLDIQNTIDNKSNSVKMGFVLPAIVKTEGENSVNTTNKLLSFDGTFTEMFKTNVGETDTDTSYLIGGGQSNNKAIPIRFIGKMDTKTQTKNIVASILLFEYHISLYKSLNNALPIFEASQLIASKTKVLKEETFLDRLSFFKRIYNIFSKKKLTVKEKENRFSVKDVEKSVLSKTVDEILDVFVYGQRMKPQILNVGPFGNVDLSKVSSGILGFAAKSIFIFNIISSINNSLSTRLQIIINSAVKSNLYSLNNVKNAQAKAPKYTKDLFLDWTKLGNKSLIGQVLDYFSFLSENPSREITSKSEFTALKNKMEFLTSPKQMSEFEVLFIQFLTIADATPIKINGELAKLSNIEQIFEIKDGKLQIKNGVEFSKEQQRTFRNKYQSLARKVAGAYRTTEISSIETNWAGKSAMFLRRYFVGLATNRFQGERFSIQEGDIYKGYQRETVVNLIRLFKEYKLNFTKYPEYWNSLSEKEKASHIKMLLEYGILLVTIGLFSILGGGDEKRELKNNSWIYNMQLVALLRARTELEQFTVIGIPDLLRIGKNPFMVFQTLGNVWKTISLVVPTILGNEDAFYKQGNDLYSPIFGKFHEKGDSKLLATFLKTIGHTGASFSPEEYLINFRNAQNRY